MQDKELNFTVVPYTSLSAETLSSLIDSFIQREATDYGLQELTNEEKHRRLLKQIHSKNVFIVFDPTLDSCTIIKKEDLKKVQNID